MTTMVDLAGRFPVTIEHQTPSDRHREPVVKLRAGICTQLHQGSAISDSLKPFSAMNFSTVRAAHAPA
jgi:hypothetical protein